MPVVRVGTGLLDSWPGPAPLSWLPGPWPSLTWNPVLGPGVPAWPGLGYEKSKCIESNPAPYLHNCSSDRCEKMRSAASRPARQGSRPATSRAYIFVCAHDICFILVRCYIWNHCPEKFCGWEACAIYVSYMCDIHMLQTSEQGIIHICANWNTC